MDSLGERCFCYLLEGYVSAIPNRPCVKRSSNGISRRSILVGLIVESAQLRVTEKKHIPAGEYRTASDMAGVISTRRTILISALLGVLGLLLVAFVCFTKLGAKADDIGASRFGMHVITMPQGNEIYAKREVRAQNFDVVAISKNPKVCESANSDTDLIFFSFCALGLGCLSALLSLPKHT